MGWLVLLIFFLSYRPSHIPLMDDLGFAVAQDPQTADLIRVLDAKKKAAVKGTLIQHIIDT